MDQNDQFIPNYSIGRKNWSLSVENPQDFRASPLLVPVDNTPMQNQRTNPRWIFSKARRSKQSLMPDNDNSRINGYISESKRSSGTRNTFGVRMCQRLAYTGNYIIRAICKAVLGEAIDEPNPASTSDARNRSIRRIQPRITFVGTARSNRL